MMVGASTAWIAAGIASGTFVLSQIATSADPTELAWWIAAGALGGMLPDLDAPQARIHNLMKGLTKPIGVLAKHRNFFHSLLAAALVFLVGSIAESFVDVRFLALALTTGFLSHIAIDMLTPGGVRTLFPLKKKLRWLPRKIAPKTGGIVDYLLLLGAGFVVASLLVPTITNGGSLSF